jgi:hypothetical protein
VQQWASSQVQACFPLGQRQRSLGTTLTSSTDSAYPSTSIENKPAQTYQAKIRDLFALESSTTVSAWTPARCQNARTGSIRAPCQFEPSLSRLHRTRAAKDRCRRRCSGWRFRIHEWSTSGPMPEDSLPLLLQAHCPDWLVHQFRHHSPQRPVCSFDRFHGVTELKELPRREGSDLCKSSQ